MSKGKKLYSDKRWTQPIGFEVIGHSKVTDDEKQRAEEFIKQNIIKETDNNNVKE